MYNAKIQSGAPIAEYARVEAAKASRIAELKNARAVLATLSGYDSQISNIGLELSRLEVA